MTPFLRLSLFPSLLFLLATGASSANAGETDTRSISRLKAQAFYYENRIKNDSLDKEEKQALFDSLQSIYRTLGQEDDLFRVQKQNIVLLQNLGASAEALQACRHYLSLQKEKKEWNRDDSLRNIELELKTGALSISSGLYEEGASHMLNVLKMPAPGWCLTQAYSYLGYIFMRNNRPDKSMEYHQKALAAYRNLPDDSVKRNQCTLVFNHLAGLYYSLEKFDSAIACLEKAIECSEERSVKRLYSYHNMSLIYMELEEYAKAEEYLQKTVFLAQKEKIPYLQAAALQNLASLYKELGRMKEAERYFKTALDLSEKMHFNDILSNTMIEYADLLFKKGDCQGFREYYVAGVAKRDSVTGALNQEKIDLLNFKHETYRMESEKKILEQNLALTSVSNQKKTVVVASLGLLLLLVSLYMFGLIRKLRKQAKENLFMNTQMDHIRMEMEKQETDSRNLLHTSLEKKNRELASRALYLVQVNDLLQNTLHRLDQLENCNPKERKERVESLKDEIRNFNGNIDGWKDFRLYFEQIHQDFYNRLLKEAPNLSPIEQRLCALLASNLTQKEIAEITNRSVRTVETMIYRIRKKFRIPSEMKMSAFLQKFLQD